MDIADLLVSQPKDLLSLTSSSLNQSCHATTYDSSPSSPSASSSSSSSSASSPTATINDSELMSIWNSNLGSCGFQLRAPDGSSKLTDALLDDISTPSSNNNTNPYMKETSIHIKVIGRHMNGSFRCHIGMGKASRPIRTVELSQHMRLLAVFFRPEKSKNNLVSPTFILFPTWLLHLFRYTQHNGTPGRTDVRFLENEMLAKEDHIYRLNHVINTLFRFNLHAVDIDKLRSAIKLTNFLFDVAGLDQTCLPRPDSSIHHPRLYSIMMKILNSPRPPKSKPVCHNCNTKPASRRKLCVACYRYQLKHGIPRPLRLIIASRHNCRVSSSSFSVSPTRSSVPSLSLSYVSTATANPATSMDTQSSIIATFCQQQQHVLHHSQSVSNDNNSMAHYSRRTGWYEQPSFHLQERQQQHQQPVGNPATKIRKSCANCGIQHTHQWYRNLCGTGHWCETCKSYYLRHSRVRPPQLFVKAAKRKVDVRALVNWSSVALPSPTIEEPIDSSSPELVTSIDSPVSSNGQTTPVQTHLQYAAKSTPTPTTVVANNSSVTTPVAASTTVVANNSSVTTPVAASTTTATTEAYSSSSSNNVFVYYHHHPHHRQDDGQPQYIFNCDK